MILSALVPKTLKEMEIDVNVNLINTNKNKNVLPTAQKVIISMYIKTNVLKTVMVTILIKTERNV